MWLSFIIENFNQQKSKAMKKFLIAAIAFVGIATTTFAQSATAAKDTKKTQAVKHKAEKVKPVATTAKAEAAKTTKAVTPVANAATPVKHDGTPDMRYKKIRKQLRQRKLI